MVPEETNVSVLMDTLYQEHGQIFFEKLGDTLFVYKPLGREEYEKILKSKTGIPKKEIRVCKTCTLYPKDYDFAHAKIAGLPSKLCEQILKQSLLDSPERLQETINYFQDIMDHDITKQMTLMIREAFPEFSVEEIESWDVLKLSDYIVKSKFILDQLRNHIHMDDEGNAERIEEPEPDFLFNEDTKEIPDIEEEEDTMRIHQDKLKSLQEWTKAQKDIPAEKQQESHQDGKILHKGDKLTPERLRQLQQLYPDIDWAHDSVSMRGMDALRGQKYDDRPPAEIPLDGSEDGQEALPIPLRKRFRVISEKHI